jgi:transposase
MTTKNKCSKGAKISEKKFREILEYFFLDLNASQITKLTGLNRNTVNRFLKEIRMRVTKHCQQSSQFLGEVEVVKAVPQSFN